MCLLFCPQNDSSDSESLVLDVILGLSLYKPQGLGGSIQVTLQSTGQLNYCSHNGQVVCSQNMGGISPDMH